jgi:uncharacterized membrane protein YphA (DoxX/SURF4 family)
MNLNYLTMKRILLIMLVLLRVLVGWLFAVEGISKILNPSWSAEGYLTLSKGIIAPVFHWIAANPALLGIADFVVTWGLTIIGIGLILGLFSRISAIAGASLLFLFYLANPPLIGADFGILTEGQYLWVDKNLIHILVCIILAIVPTGHFIGLERLLSHWFDMRKNPLLYFDHPTPAHPVSEEDKSSRMNRRELLTALATTPVIGALIFGVLKRKQWESYEYTILKNLNLDGFTGATGVSINTAQLKDLKTKIPVAKISNGKFSRVMLGGNLMGGWAHARDLIYVDKLIKTYHTDDKVFETFYLAEQCGFNTVMLNKINFEVFLKYRKRNIGNMQFITQVDTKNEEAVELARRSIDVGASGGYMMGCGAYANPERIDFLHRMMEVYQSQGMPAGIGAHSIGGIKSLVEMGVKPDFVMKTFHTDDYWSARPGEAYNDNRYCNDHDETIRFFSEHPEIPWIAFKILAAGAIKPKIALPYAFNKGADFVCLGMYDFQVIENANLITDCLNEGFPIRERRWYA